MCVCLKKWASLIGFKLKKYSTIKPPKIAFPLSSYR